MDENEFSKAVEQELLKIYEELDELCEELDIEIDYSEDVIYIENNAGGEFVINRHGPTKQIWLSSPISGAGYFSFDNRSEEWVNNDGEILREKIHNELKN